GLSRGQVPAWTAASRVAAPVWLATGIPRAARLHQSRRGPHIAGRGGRCAAIHPRATYRWRIRLRWRLHGQRAVAIANRQRESAHARVVDPPLSEVTCHIPCQRAQLLATQHAYPGEHAGLHRTRQRARRVGAGRTQRAGSAHQRQAAYRLKLHCVVASMPKASCDPKLLTACSFTTCSSWLDTGFEVFCPECRQSSTTGSGGKPCLSSSRMSEGGMPAVVRSVMPRPAATPAQRLCKLAVA